MHRLKWYLGFLHDELIKEAGGTEILQGVPGIIDGDASHEGLSHCRYTGMDVSHHGYNLPGTSEVRMRMQWVPATSTMSDPSAQKMVLQDTSNRPRGSMLVARNCMPG